jgi:hypothetical protein
MARQIGSAAYAAVPHDVVGGYAADYRTTSSMACADPNAVDPVGSCLFREQGYDTINEFGPTSTPCRTFMAPPCAKEWTAECELFSRNRDDHVPDEYTQAEDSAVRDGAFARRTTNGERHVRRTAERRFCRAVGERCHTLTVPFNQLAVGTPLLHTDVGECSLVCDVWRADDTTPGADVLLDKCLDAPDQHATVLDGMCDVAIEASTRGEATATTYTINDGSRLQEYCRARTRHPLFEPPRPVNTAAVAGAEMLAGPMAAVEPVAAPVEPVAAPSGITPQRILGAAVGAIPAALGTAATAVPSIVGSASALTFTAASSVVVALVSLVAMSAVRVVFGGATAVVSAAGATSTRSLLRLFSVPTPAPPPPTMGQQIRRAFGLQA